LFQNLLSNSTFAPRYDTVRRALRNVALGKAGFGAAQPEMRGMSMTALSKLAKYKVEHAKSQQDKMWEPKSVKPQGL
jgi:hypothetical protein